MKNICVYCVEMNKYLPVNNREITNKKQRQTRAHTMKLMRGDPRDPRGIWRGSTSWTHVYRWRDSGVEKILEISKMYMDFNIKFR